MKAHTACEIEAEPGKFKGAGLFKKAHAVEPAHSSVSAEELIRVTCFVCNFESELLMKFTSHLDRSTRHGPHNEDLALFIQANSWSETDEATEHFWMLQEYVEV